MLNSLNGVRVRRYCSIPYEFDSEAGTVVGCRNEPVGTVEGMVEGLNGELEPIELEICAYHRDKYGLKDEGPFSLGLDKPSAV